MTDIPPWAAQSDPHAIAAKLTKAQRAKLLELPAARDFKPAFYGQWPSLSCLKSKRLINGVKDGIAGMGKNALHRLTPLGLAVRAAIKEQDDAE